ncbi:MAG TPA: GNAT family N-acetyltransferase [Clostridiales bacterium]|nr:GNAT family N-acetyltransferase [Clostridiales bacterium]
MDTKLEGFQLRFAKEKDCALILEFIKDLAEYEKMSHVVVATEEDLAKYLFEQKTAEVIIGEYNRKPVAFALFFHNFSTFLGKPGLYLEDVYVKTEMRGRGIGSIILSYLAKLAKERNCGRMEWSCLNWNEPSIAFYKKLGAVPLDEWTVYRLQDEALDDMAENFDHTLSEK